MSRRTVAAAITDAIGPTGFRRRGTRWYRKVGDVSDIVSLTTSKAGDMLSVELGVFDPSVYELVWSTPKTVTEADAMVRADLGSLAGVAGEWGQDIPDSGDEIVRLLQAHGLRWLDRMHSAQARIAELGSQRLLPTEAVMLAVAEALAGHSEQARERLRHTRDEVDGPWRTKIESILAKFDELAPRDSRL